MINRTKGSTTTYKQWVSHRIDDDVQRSLTNLQRLPDVQHIAVMPDVHLAGPVCIGTVLATDHTVYPDAVGGDIGCGILAIQFDGKADAIRNAPDAAWLLAKLIEGVPINRHRAETMPCLSESLRHYCLSDARLEKSKTRDGKVQLGTLGRGNHFIEFLSDELDNLWLMIHSGSRAMGQAIKARHVESIDAGRRIVGLDIREPEGQAYVHDMQWARQYASANRLAMLSVVVELLYTAWSMNPIMDSLVHTDHNHVQCEEHFGKSLWVHRKGAQRVEKNGRGIVPGSMATASFLVTGQGNEDALFSCSHGAGRKLSRVEARRRISRSEFAEQTENIWLDRRKSRGLLDEAPGAYKDIRAVMKAQRKLVNVKKRLTPIINFKGR